MPDFGKEHLKNIKQAEREIYRMYETAIGKISFAAGKISFNKEVFRLKEYPDLSNKVKKSIKDLHGDLHAAIVTNIGKSWELSKKKNEKEFNIKLDERAAAREAFTKRRENGLNLSDRVWKVLEPFKNELEVGLAFGINEGKSAQELARDLKKHLREPDRLFRRVRDKNQNLVLSQAAKNYHPGQGVYRSSVKNAQRLTRTETNMAYHTADRDRWAELPFVVGYEIRLSNMHPVYDICDQLKGKYPKDFVWNGWHPQCLCHMIPVLMDPKEYDKLENAILDGETPPGSAQVATPPPAFGQYVARNRERIEGWKNTPYWYRDNPHYFDTNAMADKIKELKKIEGANTLTMHTKDGSLTPERLALHDKIIQTFINRGSTAQGRNFMLGGAPANGKSTLVKSCLLPTPKGILEVDSDAIKLLLPEYKLMTKGGDLKAAAFAHEESSMLHLKIIKAAQEKNYDFLSDGVGDGGFDALARKIEGYRKGGRDIRADYVTLDTDLSVKLARKRAEQTLREVPLNYILSMNREISRLVPQIIDAGLFDEFFLWDTNKAGKPRLILSQVAGKLKIKNKSLYDRFLKKGL